MMKSVTNYKMVFTKKREKKKTLYQDCDALFFTKHRCSTQQEADHNPLDRKPVISVNPWEHKTKTKPVIDRKDTLKKDKQLHNVCSMIFISSYGQHFVQYGFTVHIKSNHLLDTYLCWKLCSRWEKRAGRTGRTKGLLDPLYQPPYWDEKGGGKKKEKKIR